VAAQPKAWTVFARSNAGIVGSNTPRGMDICVSLFCVCVVLCIGRGLVTGWSPSKEAYRLCIRSRNCKRGQDPTKGCRAKIIVIIIIININNGNVIDGLWRPPLWSNGQSFWLQIQRSRFRFPVQPDFLMSSGFGTGSTQPCDYNWGAHWMEK
jgi:hypothetical protein